MATETKEVTKPTPETVDPYPMLISEIKTEPEEICETYDGPL